MIKIEYPFKSKDLEAFHQLYIDMFDIATLNSDLAIFFTRHANLNQFTTWTARSILLLPVGELIDLSISLNEEMTNAQSDELKLIFNYDNENITPKHQPVIAQFFMENKSVDISTCYFCNVDHIYSFDNVDDYQNSEDFYRRATKKDLMAIKGIGPANADTIINGRNSNIALSALPLDINKKNNLKNLQFKTKKNHFTLDHMLGKARHPIAALSLYNFVPSCYSCNSKFKKGVELIASIADEFISPTSENYSFSGSVRFKIYFPLNSTLTFFDIKKPGDFVLNFEVDKGAEAYEEYIRALKLRPRYIFHKQEILKLIRRRKKYSVSQLKEIADVTHSSIDQVKKDIFGEELFDNEYRNSSLIKLKRDIAKDVGII